MRRLLIALVLLAVAAPPAPALDPSKAQPPYRLGVVASPPPLATGPAIGPTSLVLHRPGIYWTETGTVRGAGYPGG